MLCAIDIGSLSNYDDDDDDNDDFRKTIGLMVKTTVTVTALHVHRAF